MKSILVTATLAHFTLFGINFYFPARTKIKYEQSRSQPTTFSAMRIKQMRNFPALNYDCGCPLKELKEENCILVFKDKL